MCFVVLTIVVGLGSSHSAEAQPGDPPATFRWDNDNQKAGFKACMEVVDWVTHGRQGSSPHTITGGIFNQSDIPGGLSLEAWGTAVDKDYLIGGVHTQEFTYRPKCHTLLPGDYVTRLMNVWPDAFARCMGAVHANGQSQERPKVVPGWYWEVSLAVKDCYLLLPLNAFGLEGTNAWDGWTADQEVAGPDSNSDPKVMEDYGHCKDFIGWTRARPPSRSRPACGTRPSTSGGTRSRSATRPSPTTGTRTASSCCSTTPATRTRRR